MSAWVATELSQLWFRLIHIPGELNVQSDALSRYPFIRVHAFHFHGTEPMWRTLLERLPDDVRSATRLWVYAGPETARMARLVQGVEQPE